jgi:hypothetical protein
MGPESEEALPHYVVAPAAALASDIFLKMFSNACAKSDWVIILFKHDY